MKWTCDIDNKHLHKQKKEPTLHTISTLHYEQQRWYLLLTTNNVIKESCG